MIVNVEKSVWKTLKKVSRNQFPDEMIVGIFGIIDNAEGIKIVTVRDVLIPKRTWILKQTPTQLKFSTEEFNEACSLHSTETGLTFLGTVHTHPSDSEGDYTVDKAPSFTDWTNLGNEPVMGILWIRKYGYRFIYELNFWESSALCNTILP